MSREPGDLPSETKNPIARRVFRARSQVLTRDAFISADVAGNGPGASARPAAETDVTIVVCASCRDETGSDAHPRAGALLARNTEDAAAGAVQVRSVECLGNCKRRLSAALLRDGCWTYVFGDLAADSGADLVAGAHLFANSTDGLIPWRGRPDSLKRGLVARIPPLDMLKDVP
jgi:predicted metal-binding protein